MASILVLTSKLISMMLMMAVGFMTVRLGILKTEHAKQFSTLTVYILTPCLILNAFQITMTKERLYGFLAAFVLSMACYLIWIIVSKLLSAPFHFDAIDRTTMIYPNVGNLVLPLVSMVLGNEMVFYASAMQIPFNLYMWTHGISSICGSKSISLRKLFLNSNMIALIVSLIFLAGGIRLPDVIGTTVAGFSDMVGPLSMLTIGMTIAGSSLKKAFALKKAYLVLTLRLIVYPVLILALLFMTGFLQAHPSYVPILQVTFMAIAAPPGATVAQLAVVYDNQPMKASIYSVLGNLLCILTIPVIMALYQAVFS